jgi:hypothetical protein
MESKHNYAFNNFTNSFEFKSPDNEYGYNQFDNKSIVKTNITVTYMTVRKRMNFITLYLRHKLISKFDFNLLY